jgi:cytochrome c-type biogenesis protein
MAGDLNVFLAVAAGVLSFLSPCVLPLIPSYISFIGGVSLQDLQGSEPKRGPVVVRTLSFVLGFSIVFIVLGIVFSGSGFLLGGATRLINYIAGGVVIVLGLNVIFDFWKFLNFERRLHVTSAPRVYRLRARGHGIRRRLDPLHRPDPCRHPLSRRTVR